MQPSLRANFLMNSLFEFFVVDDGSNLTLAVGGPKWGGHFNPGFTGINPKKETPGFENLELSKTP